MVASWYEKLAYQPLGRKSLTHPTQSFLSVATAHMLVTKALSFGGQEMSGSSGYLPEASLTPFAYDLPAYW